MTSKDDKLEIAMVDSSYDPVGGFDPSVQEGRDKSTVFAPLDIKQGVSSIWSPYVNMRFSSDAESEPNINGDSNQLNSNNNNNNNNNSIVQPFLSNTPGLDSNHQNGYPLYFENGSYFIDRKSHLIGQGGDNQLESSEKENIIETKTSDPIFIPILVVVLFVWVTTMCKVFISSTQTADLVGIDYAGRHCNRIRPFLFVPLIPNSQFSPNQLEFESLDFTSPACLRSCPSDDDIGKNPTLGFYDDVVRSDNVVANRSVYPSYSFDSVVCLPTDNSVGLELLKALQINSQKFYLWSQFRSLSSSAALILTNCFLCISLCAGFYTLIFLFPSIAFTTSIIVFPLGLFGLAGVFFSASWPNFSEIYPLSAVVFKFFSLSTVSTTVGCLCLLLGLSCLASVFIQRGRLQPAAACLKVVSETVTDVKAIPLAGLFSSLLCSALLVFSLSSLSSLTIRRPARSSATSSAVGQPIVADPTPLRRLQNAPSSVQSGLRSISPSQKIREPERSLSEFSKTKNHLTPVSRLSPQALASASARILPVDSSWAELLEAANDDPGAFLRRLKRLKTEEAEALEEVNDENNDDAVLMEVGDKLSENGPHRSLWKYSSIQDRDVNPSEKFYDSGTFRGRRLEGVQEFAHSDFIFDPLNERSWVMRQRELGMKAYPDGRFASYVEVPRVNKRRRRVSSVVGDSHKSTSEDISTITQNEKRLSRGAEGHSSEFAVPSSRLPERQRRARENDPMIDDEIDDDEASDRGEVVKYAESNGEQYGDTRNDFEFSGLDEDDRRRKGEEYLRDSSPGDGEFDIPQNFNRKEEESRYNEKARQLPGQYRRQLPTAEDRKANPSDIGRAKSAEESNPKGTDWSENEDVKDLLQKLLAGDKKNNEDKDSDGNDLERESVRQPENAEPYRKFIQRNSEREYSRNNVPNERDTGKYFENSQPEKRSNDPRGDIEKVENNFENINNGPSLSPVPFVPEAIPSPDLNTDNIDKSDKDDISQPSDSAQEPVRPHLYSNYDSYPGRAGGNGSVPSHPLSKGSIFDVVLFAVTSSILLEVFASGAVFLTACWTSLWFFSIPDLRNSRNVTTSDLWLSSSKMLFHSIGSITLHALISTISKWIQFVALAFWPLRILFAAYAPISSLCLDTTGALCLSRITSFFDCVSGDTVTESVLAKSDLWLASSTSRWRMSQFRATTDLVRLRMQLLSSNLTNIVSLITSLTTLKVILSSPLFSNPSSSWYISFPISFVVMVTMSVHFSASVMGDCFTQIVGSLTYCAAVEKFDRPEPICTPALLFMHPSNPSAVDDNQLPSRTDSNENTTHQVGGVDVKSDSEYAGFVDRTKEVEMALLHPAIGVPGWPVRHNESLGVGYNIDLGVSSGFDDEVSSSGSKNLLGHASTTNLKDYDNENESQAPTTANL